MPRETDTRIVIDRELRESGWTLEGLNRNVLTEEQKFSDLVQKVEKIQKTAEI